MSGKRNTSKARIRLLVDTSFLLPALGIETDEDVIEAIKSFHDAEVYYLDISILEVMWKVLRLVPSDKIDRVMLGIQSIVETYRKAPIPPSAYIDAYEIYHAGHKDYIDNLLYAVSRRLGLPLLTIDKEFVDFLKNNGYPTDNIVSPEDL